MNSLREWLAPRKLPHKLNEFKPFLGNQPEGGPTRNDTLHPPRPPKPHSS